MIKKGIKVTAPEEHKKSFEEFKKLVESGELDVELLRIYQEALVKAEYLLGIFKEEKRKFYIQNNASSKQESCKRKHSSRKNIFQTHNSNN